MRPAPLRALIRRKPTRWNCGPAAAQGQGSESKFMPLD